VILLLLALACPSREIPPHLQVERPAAQAKTAKTIDALLRADPLVRRPDPASPGDWMSLPSGGEIESWAAVARKTQATPSEWITLEQSHPGTIAVPLARGARLAALEVTLAGQLDEPALQAASAWLGTTRVEVRPTTQQPRGPLDWLPGVSPADKRKAALHIAERSVLLGWLAGPEIALQPVAKALAGPAHSRLLESPAGSLLLSRARSDSSPQSARLGSAALIAATTLALATAAADRDSEQDKLNKRLKQAAEDLSTGPDPIASLLARARVGLTADAGQDRSAGLALVALTAQRLHKSCEDAPCTGLDRTQSLSLAARWSSTSAALARAWRVVALKQAADTFAASHHRPSFGSSISDIVDPLSGTGGGSVELSLLRYRYGEPTAILQIAQLAGHPATTDPDETLRAINRRLVAACDSALRAGLPKPAATEVRKIRDRAARR
jgi:hypothetical protein